MPPPLSVDEALARILDGVAPTPAEAVAIEAAHRRTLAEPLAALITQPPFDASAMDGYAVRAADVARLPATLDADRRGGGGASLRRRRSGGTGRAHLHRCTAAGRRRCRRHPGERRTRRGQGDRARGHAGPRARPPHGLRFPRGRDPAPGGPAPRPPRGGARRRHGARDRAGPPVPARCRHFHGGRAGGAGQPAWSWADHLLQPSGRGRARRGGRRRRPSCWASPATRARAWRRISRARKAPT